MTTPNESQPMEGGVRRSCIDFAEWILKEGFEKYEDNGKCWWGRFKEEDKDYSTEQLYEMWSGNYANSLYPHKQTDVSTSF